MWERLSLSIRESLLRFGQDSSGGYVVIAALAMPVVIGSVGLGTEVGLWFYRHQLEQGAADSAALSAANASAAGEINVTPQAYGVAAAYGLVAGTDGVTVTVNKPPVSGSHQSTQGAVEVIVSSPQKLYFSTLWGSRPITIKARAVAVAPNGGKGCVVALSSSSSGAVTAQGSSSIALNGCSLYDNSSSGSALSIGGSASFSALSVGVVGGVSGTSQITTTQGITTGAQPAADPYAGSSYPRYSGCDQTNFTAKSTATINPGVYCGGMALNAGANVTLNPGVYYLDQGSLSVNGGATLSGAGVTLVFTSSSGSDYATATINGGATINLTAPSSGALAGIVIFGDRNMPTGASFKFNGGASQVFGGALYVPKAAVSFAGGSGTGTDCTQLVADTVSFVGNSNFAVNCSSFGTKPLGSTQAVLVE